MRPVDCSHCCSLDVWTSAALAQQSRRAEKQWLERVATAQVDVRDAQKRAVSDDRENEEAGMALQWSDSLQSVDWEELSNLYRIAPLGEKKAADLKVVFTNSMYRCFVHEDGVLVGAGRAVADGIDVSYLADIAVHPERQGRGIGKEIVERLRDHSKHHRKIILYAAPGKDTFYLRLGFKRMLTAMAVFADEAQAVRDGIVAP